MPRRVEQLSHCCLKIFARDKGDKLVVLRWNWRATPPPGGSQQAFKRRHRYPVPRRSDASALRRLWPLLELHTRTGRP